MLDQNRANVLLEKSISALEGSISLTRSAAKITTGQTMNTALHTIAPPILSLPRTLAPRFPQPEKNRPHPVEWEG